MCVSICRFRKDSYRIVESLVAMHVYTIIGDCRENIEIKLHRLFSLLLSESAEHPISWGQVYRVKCSAHFWGKDGGEGVRGCREWGVVGRATICPHQCEISQ